MFKKKNTRVSANNSNTNSPAFSKLRESLTNGGTITYTFLVHRTKYSKRNPDGVPYTKVSHTRTHISKNIMLDEKNNRRTLVEIMEILESGAHDLGATSFTIEPNQY